MNNNILIKLLKILIILNHCILKTDPIFGSRFLNMDHLIFIDIIINNLFKKIQKSVIDMIQKIIFRSKFWILITFSSIKY